MYNRIIQGECAAVLKTLPAQSVDFVLTDPPYLVRYKDRDGRTIQNDSDPGFSTPSPTCTTPLSRTRFAYRSLAGTRGCILRRLESRRLHPGRPHRVHQNLRLVATLLAIRHESAYVLAKGRPPCPPRRSAMSGRGSTPAIASIRPRNPSTRSGQSSRPSANRMTLFSIPSRVPAAALLPLLFWDVSTSVSSLSRNTARSPGGAWPGDALPQGGGMKRAIGRSTPSMAALRRLSRHFYA